MGFGGLFLFEGIPGLVEDGMGAAMSPALIKKLLKHSAMVEGFDVCRLLIINLISSRGRSDCEQELMTFQAVLDLFFEVAIRLS